MFYTHLNKNIEILARALRYVVKRPTAQKLPFVRALAERNRARFGPTLSELLHEAGFELVDIGARGGAIGPLLPLAPFSHYYACEPDEETHGTLVTQLRAQADWRSVTLIPAAIGSSPGNAALYLTRKPGLSSLLGPNRAVTQRFFPGGEFDVVDTTTVPTVTLEQAAQEYGFDEACFLKLDTQGSELDILKSGAGLLEGPVLGVYVEVEFQPFYVDQPLFADVDIFLRGHGLSLFDLQRVLMRRAPYVEQVQSRRQVVWAHAVYLKDPDVALDVGDEVAFKRAARLLGLALAFDHHDFATELVTEGRAATLLAERCGPSLRSDVEAFARHRTHVLRRAVRFPTRSNLAARDYRDRNYRV